VTRPDVVPRVAAADAAAADDDAAADDAADDAAAVPVPVPVLFVLT
jgi:hypothetical protein